jgi:hypothetical protein
MRRGGEHREVGSARGVRHNSKLGWRAAAFASACASSAAHQRVRRRQGGGHGQGPRNQVSHTACSPERIRGTSGAARSARRASASAVEFSSLEEQSWLRCAETFRPRHLPRWCGRPIAMSAPCTRGWHPGFVVDTKLEPGARIVTFANGMVVREPIVAIDDVAKRLVWSAEGGLTKHYNASVQVFAEVGGRTRVVWIADFLPERRRALSQRRWRPAQRRCSARCRR